MEAVSFATFEATSWREVRRVSLSLWRALREVLVSSSCLVMATIPKTVAHSMERMGPSPAEIVYNSLGERFWTREGSRRRASRVSAKILPRNTRGGGVLRAGESEAGLLRRGVLALEIAWARAWLPGGMGGIFVMDGEGVIGARKCPGSKAEECKGKP